MKVPGRTLTVGELVAEIAPPAHPDPLPVYVSDGETELAVAGIEERSGGGWVLRVPRTVEVDEDLVKFLAGFVAREKSVQHYRREARDLLATLGP